MFKVGAKWICDAIDVGVPPLFLWQTHTHTHTIKIDANEDTLALEVDLACEAGEGFLAWGCIKIVCVCVCEWAEV